MDYVTYNTLAIPFYDHDAVRAVQKFCKSNSFCTGNSELSEYETWSFKKAVASNGVPVLILSCDFNNYRQGKYALVEAFIRNKLHRQPMRIPLRDCAEF